MNNSSVEFEKWYSSIGGYGDAHKKDLWECWEASRAAIRVDLPPVWSVEQSDYRNEVGSVLDEVGVYYI